MEATRKEASVKMDKQTAVLSYANEAKLAKVILDLGFFKQAKSLPNCEELFAKNLTFKLAEVIGGHVVDIVVHLPWKIELNEHSTLELHGPRKFFMVFDLELKDILKAIRYIRLLLAPYSDRSKPHPILFTCADRGTEILEKQGIKAYHLPADSSREKGATE